MMPAPLAALALAAGLAAAAPLAAQSPDDMRREIEAEYARLKASDRAAHDARDPVEAQHRLSRAVQSPKIAAGALGSYPRSGYPKTYAAWGDAGVARIIEHERNAALLVAADPACDVVEMVGLSSRSRVPDHVVAWVDCRNKRRYYVGPEDIARGRP